MRDLTSNFGAYYVLISMLVPPLAGLFFNVYVGTCVALF